jgi:heparan-alpha-glucosaminide N-acetyltransferase
LLSGELLRSNLTIIRKLKRLVLFGVAGTIGGALIALVGLCPIIKRIWTPSWAICSAGWVTLILAGFVAIVEWRGWKRWTFPFVIVGLNPITLYCMWQLMGGFIRENVQRHIGRHIFELFGPAYVPVLERATVLLVLWLVILWMYRRKIFLRI